MPTIYDAILGEVKSGDEYTAANPFYRAGTALRATQIQPKNSSEAIWAPIVMALAGGAMQGFGKSMANDQAHTDYGKLINKYAPQTLTDVIGNIGPVANGDEYGAALDPTHGVGPVASGDIYGKNLLASAYASKRAPDGWTPEVGKQDLLAALLEKQKADVLKEEEAKSAIALQAALLKDNKVLNPITGKIELAPGAAETISQEAAAKKSGESPQTPVGLYDKLSADEKTRYGAVASVAAQLDKLAEKASGMNATALDLMAQSWDGKSKYSLLKADVKNLLPSIRKAASDTGNSALGEQAQTLDALLGGTTTGSESIAMRMSDLSKQLRESAKASLESRKTGMTGGIDEVMKLLDSGAATTSTIPEGATKLPGKIDKVTGKQIYLVNGRPWVEP